MVCIEDETKDKCATELYKETKAKKFQLDLAYFIQALSCLLNQ